MEKKIETKELKMGIGFWKRFRRNQMAVFGGILLIIFYTLAIFADVVAPYGENTQNRKKSYHPPTAIHFFDEEGHFSLRPFFYNYKLTDMIQKRYEPVKDKKYYIHFFFRGTKYKLFGLIPWDIHLFGVEEPANIYILGTDILGRCVFSRILFGSRISLSIGLFGIAITYSLGLLFGGISGYFGGKMDWLLMRLCEVLMSVPGLYLILAIRAALPLSMSSAMVYLVLVCIFGFIGWAGAARVIRGMVLSIKQRDFVVAAEAMGASTLRLIVKHILPSTMTYVIVVATLSIPGYILGEVVLSFLGVGIQEPQASWGLMLRSAQQVRVLVSFPWIISPGFFIFAAVLAFNFFGDGVRDALDPRAHGRAMG